MNKIVLSNHISWQKVPNDSFAFVYNIRTHKYYKFEGTEIYIWEMIASNEGITLSEIISAVALHYKIDIEEIEKDISSFVESLMGVGVIEYVK